MFTCLMPTLAVRPSCVGHWVAMYTSFPWPPPFSLPYTVYYTMIGLFKLFKIMREDSSLDDEEEDFTNATGVTRLLDDVSQEEVSTRA